jgi:phosphoserine phosphatase RsbU/P
MATPVVDDRDLSTAGQLQRMLLPPAAVSRNGWTAVHVFQPAGVVSGDYIDLVPHADGAYFMLGDVSGKGIAASLLMAQLHAMFRTLVPFDLPLADLMKRASALLCASSLPAQYATLVCGYLGAAGQVEIVNAGHPPPLLVSGGSHVSVQPTGIPIGLFCHSEFSSSTHTLAPGDSLVVFSDGLFEALNPDGDEYGIERLEAIVARHASADTRELVDACVGDQARFRGSAPNADDLTILAIRRDGAHDQPAVNEPAPSPTQCRPSGERREC